MEEGMNLVGMELHPGMAVRLSNTGESGEIRSIRLLSTGETIDAYQLTETMEPLVLTLAGRGYVTKQLVESPHIVQIGTMGSGHDIEDDLALGEEKEAFDSEAVFGDGGDDGNPMQEMMDDMELGMEGDDGGW